MTTPTPDITRLRSLLERCEKASGPDRELDADLAVAMGHFDYRLRYGLEDCRIVRGRIIDANQVEVGVVGKGGLLFIDDLPKFTASLDAAVALIEKALPGWDWRGQSMGSDGCFAEVWWHGWRDDTVIHAEAKSPTLALLSALLKALIAREEQRAGEVKEDSQCAS